MKNEETFARLVNPLKGGFYPKWPDTLLIGDSWVYYFGLEWDERPAGFQLVRSSIPEMFLLLYVGREVPPVHVSGALNYLDCGRAWHYRNSDWGKGYKPDMNGKVTFGNWWHYATALMANGYTLDEAFELTCDRQVEMIGDRIVTDEELAETKKLGNLLQAHEKWNRETDDQYADKHLIYHHAEKTFDVEINGVRVQGQWDALVKHTYRGREAWYVLERKTTTNPDHLKGGLAYDFQPRVYVLAAEQYLGEPVAGVIYEIVRNTDPYNVKILKSGLPSKAQTELDGTSHEVYMEILDSCIEETGADREEVYEKYAEALYYLKRGAGPSIIQRTVVYVSDAQREQTKKHLLQLRTNMLLSMDDPVPNLRRHRCQYCPYKGVCTAHDEGWDYEMGLEFMEGANQDVPRFDAGLIDLIDTEA